MPGPLPSSHQVLVHFYRAVVGHADVWRQRMDATTNWAAATTAAMITFTFGTEEAPHFVLVLALAFNVVFLLMESRRYQAYDLWRRRFHVLNRYLISPALSGREEAEAEAIREELVFLARELGRTVPYLSLLDAVGYRIHRNYGYLFGILLLSWLLKLNAHPERAEEAAVLVERAAIGGIPGPVVAGVVAAIVLLSIFLAARAPSERMVDWTESPGFLHRWIFHRGGRGGHAPPPGEDDGGEERDAR